MRTTWTRIVAVVFLAVAVLVPTSASGAHAAVAPDHRQELSPPVRPIQECATGLSISGRTIASCGQKLGDRGRFGTYDSALGKITWGAWQSRYDLPSPSWVTSTDGYMGRFLGFPTVEDRFGRAVIHGTQYRQVTTLTGDRYWVGRRGVYIYTPGLFIPDGPDWHRTKGCLPFEPCPGWHYEPIPKRT